MTQTKSGFFAVFTACATREDALRLAREAVEARLAACVNIVPGVESVYRWKGEIQVDREWLLVLKTSEARFEALRDRLLASHPYEVPEVIALPVEEGSEGYLQWLGNELEAS